MKSTAFLSQLRHTFGLSFDRACKHGTALRGMGLFPDGRTKGEQEHVTASQAANAVLLFAVNPTPTSETYEKTLVDYLSLTDAVDAIADLLRDGGEKIFSDGVTRVSVSHQRPFVAIISENPTVKKVLNDSGSENWRVQESETTFGSPEGKRSVETFCFVKRSALLSLALALATTGRDQQTDQLLTHINN